MYSINVDIFDYDDFRVFLKKAIESIRQSDQIFSFRKFSKMAGFSSPNYLLLLMKNERNLSPKGSHKIAKALGLSEQQSQYFEYLVMFNQSKEITEKVLFSQKLLRARPLDERTLSYQDCFEFYQNWYHIPIREILLIHPSADAEFIAENLQPKISTEKAERALQLLLKLGMIEKNEEKCWKVIRTTIRSGDKVAASSLYQFHAEMMELAKKSLTSFTANDREVSSVSVGLSKGNFEKARAMIRTLKEDILQMAATENDANRIFN